MAKENAGKSEKKEFPAVLTEDELKAEIRTPSGGYLLFGAEDYLKKHYAEQFRAAALADSPVPEMNENLFDEDNYSPAALGEAIASPPLFGRFRYIAVSFADLSFLRKEEERAALIGVLKTLPDNPETLLVMTVAAGGFDPGRPKRTTAHTPFLSVLKGAEIPLQDPRRLVRWIVRHAKENGLETEPGAPEELIRLCGREMYRLSSETDKICAYENSRGSAAFTVAAVREISARSPEEGAFELANAIMNGDRRKALENVGRALKRGESPYKLIAGVERVAEELALASQYVKEGMSPYAIASKMKVVPYKAELLVRAVRGVPQERILGILSLCAETEYGMKTGAATGTVPLERLVCSAAAPRKAGGEWRR